MKRGSIAREREQLMANFVKHEIEIYLAGNRRRPCAYCAVMFKPRNRYHFLGHADCRKAFYRGPFRPRSID